MRYNGVSLFLNSFHRPQDKSSYPRCAIEEAPDNVMVLNGVDLTPITELAIDVKHVMVTPAPGTSVGGNYMESRRDGRTDGRTD